MSADNYLPEMEMPSEPEEPETEPEVSFDPLVSVAGDDEGSITMEVQDEDEDEEVEDEEVEVEEEPVPIKEKKKLRNDEVFNTPQVMAVQDPEKPPNKGNQSVKTGSKTKNEK